MSEVLDFLASPFAVLTQIGSTFYNPRLLTAFIQSITLGTAFVCILYSLQLRHTGGRFLTAIMRISFTIIGALNFWLFIKRLNLPPASLSVEVVIYRIAFFFGVTAASLRRF